MWPFSSLYPTVKPSDIGVEQATGVPFISSDIFKKDSIARTLNSLPQVHADHRVIPLMRGQVLGETSRVNPMFYTRGVPADFNLLARYGPSILELREDTAVFRPWENETFSHTTWPILPHCVPFDRATDRNMRRCSTYSAFLPPSTTRSRQDPFSSKADGRPRAIGVEFGHHDGTEATYFAKASREAVVCHDAIESPQPLLLSGIGPNNPGVGNHVDVPVMWNIPLDKAIHVIIEKPWRAIFELIKYLILGRDILSNPFAHPAIFLPTRLLNENMEIVAPDSADLDSTLPQNRPDLEIKPMPIYSLDPPPNATTIFVEGVMNFIVCLLQLKSSDVIHLNSPDPYEASCDLRMLSDLEDLAVLTKVCAQGYPIKTYHCPISDSGKGINVGSHYMSSCRMALFGGTHLGVVDDKLCVHRVDGSSVFPDIMALHTMVPVVNL
ncbi:hypothetical protein ARMGADRAFT_1045959 [Armillaria gallica]|uniref:Glucose-methanol-choline oxidoreductase N-terminal domain-containing protein n=1 Tax=Armillaria gallica TaxID=47427 RepID=A0A2H3DRH2_ARMGA|nr:hypothetical protein ARMGADRAFT_1045959 [Armillaria gallica]